MTPTDLLVIGAGPNAYSAAAHARDHGIDTHVVGHPMSFWREQMPTEMYLRSRPDWHLDGSGEHPFEAFFEDQLVADHVVFASRYLADLPGALPGRGPGQRVGDERLPGPARGTVL